MNRFSKKIKVLIAVPALAGAMMIASACAPTGCQTSSIWYQSANDTYTNSTWCENPGTNGGYIRHWANYYDWGFGGRVVTFYGYPHYGGYNSPSSKVSVDADRYTPTYQTGYDSVEGDP